MGAQFRREIIIGSNEYSIYSDDNYLKNMSSPFEPSIVKLFTTVLKKSDIVLDIGANIGCTSILFGDISKHVYSFEPSPTTFKLLHKNISLSGLKNISIFNKGLGAKKFETTLTFAPSNRSGGFVSNQTQASTGHTVENISIEITDAVMNQINPSSIDFIKIDVEGFEGEVIKGCKNILYTHRPIVVLELNHWCLNAFQRTSIPEFFDFLRSTFPILLGVDGDNFLDLHDQSDRYKVMYHHILRFRFPNILASFSEDRLSGFYSKYTKSQI